VRTSVRITSQGHPTTRLRRAIATGNPLLVRAAAAELPHVELDDALAICLVLLDSEPERYEPSAIRWLGRLLLERRCRSLLHAEAIAANLAALRHPRSSRLAALELGELCREAGLKRAGALLELRSEQRRPGE